MKARKNVKNHQKKSSLMVRRIGWGLTDQSLSSLSNFIVGVAVARSVSLAEFGVYALAFSVYSLVLGVSRALTTEPYVVVFTAASEEKAKAARAAASGLAVAVGLFVLILAFGLSFLVTENIRAMVVVVGLVMPGLLLQDSWRHIFFAAGRGFAAFANDLVWTLLLVPAFFIVFALGRVDGATLLLAWGVAGTMAAVMGMFQAHTVPDPRRCLSWLRTYRMLWPRYFGEGMAINGAQQLIYFVLGITVGLTAVGQLKLVMVVLGPVNVLVQGIGVVAVPEAARAFRKGWRRQNAVATIISAIVACGALAWGLIVYLMPVHWGVSLAGAGWVAVTALILPMFLVQVFNGSNTGPAVSLRAMGAARRSLWIRIVCSADVVVLAVAGSLTAGVLGVAWGMALAAALNAIVWLLQYLKVGLKAKENPGAFGSVLDRLDVNVLSGARLSHE